MLKHLISVIMFKCLIFPFNGNCQTWNTVGAGVNSAVNAFAVDSVNNELYVGGWFLTAGGISAPHIAKWNGNAWTGVGGGMNNNIATGITSLCFFNGELYAAGLFDSAGGIPAKNIAKWDGSNWHAVGAGFSTGYVLSLEVYNGELYAGGGFDSSGISGVKNIAKWDGNNWVDVGGGTGSYVFTLRAFNNELYAGGEFLMAGGINAYKIAKWNGFNWDTVGTGFNKAVHQLGVQNNELYASGEFTPFPGNASRLISKLNGNTWQSMPSPSGGTNPAIRGFATYNGNLFVTGEFTSPSFIAKFNGSNYIGLGSGLSWVGYSLVVYKNDLYVGGSFSSAGGLSNTSGLARWNDAVGIFENVFIDPSIVSPNPFNEQITFSIPENSESNMPYKLIIYDVQGKIIKQINNIEVFQYTLERAGITSGIYFYELQDKTSIIISRGKMIAD